MIQATMNHSAYSRACSTFLPSNKRSNDAKNVTYPQNLTVPAISGPGTPPIIAATIAVAAAAAQPGHPSWMKPRIDQNHPQNTGPGLVRMKPLMIGSPVYRV